jgi:hypothetical protein
MDIELDTPLPRRRGSKRPASSQDILSPLQNVDKNVLVIVGALILAGSGYFIYKKFIKGDSLFPPMLTEENSKNQYLTIASGHPNTDQSEWILSNAMQIDHDGKNYFALVRSDGSFDVVSADVVQQARERSPRISHIIPQEGGEVIVLSNGLSDHLVNRPSIMLKTPNGDNFLVNVDPNQLKFIVKMMNGQIIPTPTIQYATNTGIVASAMVPPNGPRQSLSISTTPPSTPPPMASPAPWLQARIDNIRPTSTHPMVPSDMGPSVHVPPMIDEMVSEQTRSNREENIDNNNDEWEIPMYTDINHGPDLYKDIF